MTLSMINRTFIQILKVGRIRTLSYHTTVVQFADEEHLSVTNDYSSIENKLDKKIPLAVEEYKRQKSLLPTQPQNPHLLKVSILGEPNVGKSTLTNKLVKWKVCAVSRKVHTTRKKASAILIEDNKQIVFLDTPGFVEPELTHKHHLEPTFVMDPLKSIREADILAVVVDISNKWTNNRISENIQEVLEKFRDKKSILVLNKIDAMKSKSRLLSLTKILTGGVINSIENSNLELDTSEQKGSVKEIMQLDSKSMEENSEEVSKTCFSRNAHQNRGWSSFSKVFMVSALKNDGINDLRNYLLNEALPKNWMYNDNIITDQHPHEIALMILREKLLEYLPEEIPYVLDLRISKWDVLTTGMPKIEMKIVCTNSKHKRFVIGPGGKYIASCVQKCRHTIKEAFKKDVFLKIAVE
ncbi:GTPase Era, mitochondrial [Trichonephila inaurata madagascariensis]|uniref:GTPase Era, mitochondrial n=1 Tax=Trichonephila inaurata madagascariensis TaxID=2747483 RepID=A0A8X6ID25_9ARAC|nr:GTPase Era, mitochondrial [Trichonephila inaurata madagascariensis]